MDAKIVRVPLSDKTKYSRIRWVEKKDGTYGIQKGAAPLDFSGWVLPEQDSSYRSNRSKKK